MDGQRHALPASSHPYSPSSSSYRHHHSTNTILGALGAGAHGICVPLLYTVDDARRLVSSAKSPPSAPAASARRSLQGPSITRAYLVPTAGDTLMATVQIETAEALENVRRSYPTPTTSYISPSIPFPIPKPIPSPPTPQTAHAHTPS